MQTTNNNNDKSNLSTSFTQNDFFPQSWLNLGASPEVLERVDKLTEALTGASNNLDDIKVEHSIPQIDGFLKFLASKMPDLIVCEGFVILLATVVLSAHTASIPVENETIKSSTLKTALLAYCYFRFPNDIRICAAVGTCFAIACRLKPSYDPIYVADIIANMQDPEYPRNWQEAYDLDWLSRLHPDIVPEHAVENFDKRFVCVDGSIRPVGGFPGPDKGGDFEAQSGNGTDAIVTTILGYLYYSAHDREIAASSMTKFLKSIGDLPKITNGIGLVVDTLISVVQKFIDFCASGLGLDPLVLKQSMFPELQEVQKDFDKLVERLRAGAPYDYDNAMCLFEIEKRVSNICAQIPSSREFSEYKTAAMSLKATIKPLVSRMERNNIVGNGPRREPLGIMLGGPTGVGKSTSIVPLILAVNAAVMPEEKLASFEKNHNDHIWNYIPENPFADSYHGQFNTIIDEAGAQWDVKGSPDPGALGALRMINTANFPLHMANLEDKGNCNFNSELVWATTNRVFFDWASMYAPQAYVRRFPLSYAVFPKKEYCTFDTKNGELWYRRLDKTKIPETASGFSEDVAEFHPHDYNTGRTSPVSYTFDELIQHIIKVYRKHRCGADRLLGFHSEIKNKYLKARYEEKHEIFHDALEELEVLEAQSGYDSWDRIKESVMGSTCYPLSLVTQAVESCKNALDTPCLHTLLGTCKRIMNEALEPFTGTWLTSIRAFLVKHKNKIFAAMAVSLPMIAMIWKFMAPLFEQQSYNVRKVTKVRPHKAKSTRAVNKVHRDAAQQQSGINMNCIAVCDKIVRQSLYKLGVQKKDESIEALGYALFVRGKCCMIPEHFTHGIENLIEDGLADANPILHFTRVGAKSVGFEVLWSDTDVTYVDGVMDDVNYLTVNSVCHEHPNIMSHIAPEGHTKLTNKFDGAMLRAAPGGGFTLVSTIVHKAGSKKYGGFSVDDALVYDIATVKGECGAPIFLVGQSNRPFIVGLHVAGNKSSGIATTIAKERVLQAFETVPFVSVELNVEAQSCVKMPDNFLVHHDVAKLRVPFNTRIVKSPLHGLWGPSECSPARLRPFEVDGEIIDPWALARSKYSKKAKCVNLYLVDAVTHDTVNEMLFSDSGQDPWPHRLYTIREAIEGVDGVPFCDAINRSTSAGYPWTLEAKGKGKSDWLGLEGPVDFDTNQFKELESEIDRLKQELEGKNRISIFYADFLKDERRKTDKVLAGKSRLVSAAPMHSIILFKMYFGDLLRWVMSNRIKNGSAIGINPYGHEWSHIVKYLSSVGDKCIFGDYSGYDGTLSPAFEYGFLILADAFYFNQSEAERNVRVSLFEDIVNSKHVTVGKDDATSVLYEWFGGNPSGNLLTTALNTFCNHNIVKYAMVSCWAKEAGTSHLFISDYQVNEIVIQMSDNVRIIAFGDDGGISISDDFAEFVDQTKLTQAMAEIGFKFTDEAKSDDAHTFRSIESCSFLKRSFKKDKNGFWRAPLELGVILEMAYWTKDNAPPGTTEAILDTAMMELSLHGEDVFNEWSAKMSVAALEKINYKPNTNYRYNITLADHTEAAY